MVVQLREVIQRSGVSLYELARKSGVDRGRLSRFIRGERDINLSAAAKVCDALGIGLQVPETITLSAVAPPPKAKRKQRKKG